MQGHVISSATFSRRAQEHPVRAVAQLQMRDIQRQELLRGIALLCSVSGSSEGKQRLTHHPQPRHKSPATKGCIPDTA